MGDLRFDGKVVLVTGAGAGLGRDYALAFAERGASVVVNDLGGNTRGDGQSVRAADKVVDEIKAKGGKAVPNYNSVEDGEKLIQTALEAFGRIDIIVNNAGILRDRTVARTSDEDWDIVHRVHLRSSFLVTRAAWEHMKKQKYGRIIMTSSGAGLYGNFGQSNYSAAKLGLVGLSQTLAKEGAKYNIHCNAIAPTAFSRLSSSVMLPEWEDILRTDYIAPMVLWLCHESCEDSGQIFEAAAGWYGKVRYQLSEGAHLRSGNKPVTPEAVRDNWEKISDFSKNASYPDNLRDRMSTLLSGATSESSPEPSPSAASSSDKLDLDRIRAHDFGHTDYNLTSRDVMLYNLGIGCSTQQEDYLKFLYENSEDFCVLPSFGVIPAFNANANIISGGLPGFEIQLAKLLHGEQYLELYAPLPTSGNLRSVPKVADLLDKGSGALLLIDVDTFDSAGKKIAYNQFSLFLVGHGGFGGPRSSSKQKLPVDAPRRSPDSSMQEKTSVDQAALYRLSGDYNPLHIDPGFAAIGGFKQPILHGLCSFGYSVRHVLKTYADNDVARFKSVKVRFSKPVLPGQSLRTDMWKEGNRIHFKTTVVETGAVCISGAYVDLHGGTEDNQAQSSDGLQSSALFEAMGSVLSQRPQVIDKIKAVFQWNITKDGKTAATWTVDVKNAPGAVHQGPPKVGKADCTLTLSDENMVAMAMGKLNGQQAFMSGKLKISGNIMLSQRLSVLFQEQSKM